MADRRVMIRFYVALKRRVADPAWPEGRFPSDWLHLGAPQRLDPVEGEVVAGDFLGLDDFTYTEDGTAYLTDPEAIEGDPDPDVYFMRCPHETDNYVHLRFWKVRRSQLPSRHDLSDGSTVPIELTETQGLAEAFDLVIFKAPCIAAVVVNRAGPSKKMALDYLAEKCGIEMRLVPLHRKGALDLVNGDAVTYVDVEVASGHLEAIGAMAPSIGEAARETAVPGLRTLRVRFGSEKEERGRFWRFFAPRAREIIALDPDGLQRLAVTQATAGAIASETVDLLEQLIGIEVPVQLAMGRTVEEEGALAAAVSGYDSHLPVLREAADGIDALAENQRTDRRRRANTPTA